MYIKIGRKVSHGYRTDKYRGGGLLVLTSRTSTISATRALPTPHLGAFVAFRHCPRRRQFSGDDGHAFKARNMISFLIESVTSSLPCRNAWPNRTRFSPSCIAFHSGKCWRVFCLRRRQRKMLRTKVEIFFHYNKITKTQRSIMFLNGFSAGVKPVMNYSLWIGFGDHL